MEKESALGFYYTKAWFAFAFENPVLVKPVHGVLYLWIVELNNRMGWAKEFSSPASQSMTACGISSYNTYKKAFEDLVQWGFVKVIQPSINQYQACKIALSKNAKAQYQALDNALKYHSTGHCRSTVQITDSINKLRNLETKKQTDTIVSVGGKPQRTSKSFVPPSEDEVKAYFLEKGYTAEAGSHAWDYYEAGEWKDGQGKPVKAWKQKMQGVWFKPENKASAAGATGRKVIMQQVPFGGEVSWTEAYYESVKATTEHKFLRYES